jgi:hypothetical protein
MRRLERLAAIGLTALSLCMSAPQGRGQLGTGQVLSWRKLSPEAGSPLAALIDPGDGFGRAVAGIGDLDGDGVIDLAVGAPFDDDSGPDAGAVYILHMLSDGSIKEVRKIVDGTGGVDLSLSGGEEFGFALAPCRDYNLDGVDDLLVGVPGARRVHVLYLQPSGPAISGETTIAAQVMDDSTLRYGAAVVQLIAPNTQNGGWGDHGWVPEETTFLCILAAGALPGEQAFWARLSIANGVHHFPDNNMDITGTCLADRTRIASVFPGDHLAYGDPASQTFFGIQTKWHAHPPPDWNEKVSTTGMHSDDLQANLILPPTDEAGASLAYVGDFVINDASNELGLAARWAVGAPGTDGQRGAVHLLPNHEGGDDLLEFGNKSEGEIHLIAPGHSGFDGVLAPGDRFGEAVHGPGDLNKDGIGDILVGAPGDATGGVGAGAIWLVFLEPQAGVGATAEFAPSLDGRPGRGSVPKSIAAGYESVFDDLLIVSPDLEGTTVHASKLVGLPTGDVLFVPTGDYASGNEPQQATLEEVDLDTAVDILAINRSGGTDFMGSVTYLQGVGDGTFVDDAPPTSPHETDLSPFSNSAPVVIGTGPMDTDAFLDAVVGGDGGVTVLFGDGAGQFPGGLTEPVSDITDLALGDLDGDGDLDALVASGAVALGPGNELGFLTPLINQGGAQPGTPGDLVAGTPFGPSPQKAVASVLLGGLDGDPGLDALVVLHELDGGPGTPPQATIQLWENDGVGAFTLGSWAGAAFPNPDRIHPTYGALGDVDNDGDIDAVFLSGDSLAYDATLFEGEYPPLEITLLINQGGDQLGTEGHFSVTPIGTAYSGKGLAPVLTDISPMDEGPPEVLGDGNLDLILVWFQDEAAGVPSSLSTFKTFLAVLKGDGAGGFTSPKPNEGDTGSGPGNPDIGNGGPAPGLDSFQGATVDPGALDVLVPNELDNSLTLLFGVGDGTLVPGSTTLAVDPTVPPLGLSGGPVDARFADLDGDPHLDVVVYSQYDDPAGVSSTVLGSVVTLLGDGNGAFAPSDWVSLPFGGDLAVDDVTGDGDVDVVVTQRLGAGAPHTLLVLPGAGDGSLAAPLAPLAAPAGHSLTGGLVVADVLSTSALDVISSSHAITGAATVWSGTGSGLGSASATDTGATWAEVTGLAATDLDGDGLPDVALGTRQGRLHVLAADGLGGLAPLEIPIAAEAAGGGPMAVADLTGDGRADLLVTSDAEPGSSSTPNPDQAFVRVVGPSGGAGSLLLDTMGGAASVSTRRGALRPLAADMDGNGQPDVILVHGPSGRVSVTPNGVGGITEFGAGKTGSGGVVPTLEGMGFPRVGETIDLVISDALGGASSGLVLGFDQNTASWLHVAQPLWELLLVLPPLSGPGGTPGAGSLTLPVAIPDDPGLPALFEQSGVALTMQVIVLDRGAGLPQPKKFAATNGLQVDIKP